MTNTDTLPENVEDYKRAKLNSFMAAFEKEHKRPMTRKERRLATQMVNDLVKGIYITYKQRNVHCNN